MTNEERNELINEIILHIKKKEGEYIKKRDFSKAVALQRLRNEITINFIEK